MLAKLLYLTLIINFIVSASAYASESLRVAVVENQATVELYCEDPFYATDRNGRRVLVPSGKYFLCVKDGNIAFDDSNTFPGTVVVARLADKSIPQVNKRTYKGKITFVQREGKIFAVNNIDIDTYLACVIPAKTMVVWPEEAIKAQIVAARSYALYMKRLNKDFLYDIRANDPELEYLGTDKKREKALITELIEATSGQHLTTSDGYPLKALTSSSSGGKTESHLDATGKEYSYLKSVEDYDSDSPEYEWERAIAPAFIENVLAQRGLTLGKLVGVYLSPLDAAEHDRTQTGRVRYLVLVGEMGSAKIAGEEFRQILNLNSTLFDIKTGVQVPESLRVPIENRYGMEIGSKQIDIKVKDAETPVWKNVLRSYHMVSDNKNEKIIFTGRGKGTGIGLSAWGARGLANLDEKITYRDILAHYYPGSVFAEG